MQRPRIKEHWVCFECRKMFKKPSRWEGVRPGQKPAAPQHVCPECKQPMRDMGVYFEPPRRGDRRAWPIMSAIAESGFACHSEGGKAYIEAFILRGNRSSLRRVKEQLAKRR